MKKLPLGIQTFEKIINEDLVYVDKTEYVFRLAEKGNYIFLSRPRRFGKSLLLSTLKSYFQGKKDLFQGLKISDLEKNWKTYPVVHIDYSVVEYKRGLATFEKSLIKHFKNIAAEFGIELEGDIVK